MERRGDTAVLALGAESPKGIAFAREKGLEVHIVRSGLTGDSEAAALAGAADATVIDVCNARTMSRPEALRAFVEGLTRRGRSVAVIDSMHEHAFRLVCDPQPDLVVTPYLGAEALPGPACGRWLAGARYAILDDGMEPTARQAHQRAEGAPNILVATGGSDPWGLTRQLLEALAGIDGTVSCRVVLGYLFPEDYREALKRDYADRFTSLEWVDAPTGLREHYCWADLVLGAAGLMRYEVGALGVPSLLVCPHDCYRAYYEGFNEAAIARILFARDPGFAADLEREIALLLRSETARAATCAKGPALVNARGKELVSRAIEDTARACRPV